MLLCRPKSVPLKKTTSHQEESSTLSFEAGGGVETGRVEGGKNKSLEITITGKGIFVFHPIFRLCSVAAASWIPTFWGKFYI